MESDRQRTIQGKEGKYKNDNQSFKIETYKYVRLAIFPNSFGISPDKRLASRELH